VGPPKSPPSGHRDFKRCATGRCQLVWWLIQSVERAAKRPKRASREEEEAEAQESQSERKTPLIASSAAAPAVSPQQLLPDTRTRRFWTLKTLRARRNYTLAGTDRFLLFSAPFWGCFCGILHRCPRTRPSGRQGRTFCAPCDRCTGCCWLRRLTRFAFY
jgi:hypothetical protein